MESQLYSFHALAIETAKAGQVDLCRLRLHDAKAYGI